MAKNKLKKYEESYDDFDTEFDDISCPDNAMLDMMEGLFEISNQQMMMAIELTKLIVANNSSNNMEEYVFSVFKKAIKIISENCAMKKIMEQMEQK